MLFNRTVFTILAALAFGTLLQIVYCVGVEHGQRDRAQHVNELLSAGFRLIDPEGYDVADYGTDSWCAAHLGGNGDPAPVE